MLKPQDIEIEVCLTDGGESVKVTHTPTAIFRYKGPPVTKRGKVQREMLREIEVELIQKGLGEFILGPRSGI